MLPNIYSNLLFLCGSLLPGILGTLLEDNHVDSTSLHLREKRMLQPSTDALYITKIIVAPELIGTGTIVSPKYVLSTEACRIAHPRGKYFVVTGVRGINPVKAHTVKEIHRRGSGDLVLFELHEPIHFEHPFMNRPMPFFESNIPPNLLHMNNYSFEPDNLHPIVTRVSVVNRGENPLLRNDEIETDQMHANHRLIAFTRDVGSPLAVGNHLVGILVTRRVIRDTYTLVHRGTDHHTWIMGHIHADLQTLENGQHSRNHK